MSEIDISEKSETPVSIPGIRNRKYAIEDVHNWRTAIFEIVADRLCDKNLSVIQRAIGMWPYHSGITLPHKRDVSILGEGAMRIAAYFGDTKRYRIDLNIWIFLGEIRMGVRVPTEVLNSGHDIREKISHAYNGSLCDRLITGADHEFYDWIFTDRFADAALMERSIGDAAKTALIADALSNLATHLYMATINAILEGGSVVPSMDGMADVAESSQLVIQAYMEDEDEYEDLKNAIQGLGILLEYVSPQPGRCLYLITYKSSADGMVRTSISNIISAMGGRFDFLEVEQV